MNCYFIKVKITTSDRVFELNPAHLKKMPSSPNPYIKSAADQDDIDLIIQQEEYFTEQHVFDMATNNEFYKAHGPGGFEITQIEIMNRAVINRTANINIVAIKSNCDDDFNDAPTVGEPSDNVPQAPPDDPDAGSGPQEEPDPIDNPDGDCYSATIILEYEDIIDDTKYKHTLQIFSKGANLQVLGLNSTFTQIKTFFDQYTPLSNGIPTSPFRIIEQSVKPGSIKITYGNPQFWVKHEDVNNTPCDENPDPVGSDVDPPIPSDPTDPPTESLPNHIKYPYIACVNENGDTETIKLEIPSIPPVITNKILPSYQSIFQTKALAFVTWPRVPCDKEEQTQYINDFGVVLQSFPLPEGETDHKKFYMFFDLYEYVTENNAEAKKTTAFQAAILDRDQINPETMPDEIPLPNDKTKISVNFFVDKVDIEYSVSGTYSIYSTTNVAPYVTTFIRKGDINLSHKISSPDIGAKIRIESPIDCKFKLYSAIKKYKFYDRSKNPFVLYSNAALYKYKLEAADDSNTIKYLYDKIKEGLENKLPKLLLSNKKIKSILEQAANDFSTKLNKYLESIVINERLNPECNYICYNLNLSSQLIPKGYATFPCKDGVKLFQ